MQLMHHIHGLRIRPADLVLRAVCAAVSGRGRGVGRLGRLSGVIALLGLLVGFASAQPPAPPPGKVIVSDVVIQGNRLVSTETSKNQMKTRVGKEYVGEVRQDDARTLFATRQF